MNLLLEFDFAFHKMRGNADAGFSQSSCTRTSVFHAPTGRTPCTHNPMHAFADGYICTFYDFPALSVDQSISFDASMRDRRQCRRQHGLCARLQRRQVGRRGQAANARRVVVQRGRGHPQCRCCCSRRRLLSKASQRAARANRRQMCQWPRLGRGKRQSDSATSLMRGRGRCSVPRRGWWWRRRRRQTREASRQEGRRPRGCWQANVPMERLWAVAMR